MLYLGDFGHCNSCGISVLVILGLAKVAEVYAPVILGLAPVAEVYAIVILAMRPVKAAEEQGVLNDMGGNQRLNSTPLP